MLLFEVSFIMSRSANAVDADQLPRNVPSSCVTASSPLLLNAKTLLARSAAETVNSVEPIVLVLDALIVRASSSSCCCTMNTSLSSESSRDCAGNGSFGTRSRPCSKSCSRRIVSVSPFAGAVSMVTLPPPASPTPLTV